MNEVKNLLIGIELTQMSAQLCYFDRKLKDPVSVPMRVGTNLYRFAMALAKLPGKEEWRIGCEAEYFHKSGEGTVLVNPCILAAEGKGEEIEGRLYSPEELLAAYIKEMLRFLGLPNPVASASGIGVVTETLTRAFSDVIKKALLLIGFRPGQCFIADFGESFYYYGYSQKTEYCARGLGLIRFYGDEVRFFDMIERRNTKPRTAELAIGPFASLPKEGEERDAAFSSMVEEWAKDKSLSSIYLTGEGFQTDWAGNSLKTLSRSSSHVFEGDNLFAKGAVWMVYELLERHSFTGRLYLGASLLRATIGLYVTQGGKDLFLPLIEAGRSCFEAEVSFDILLEGQDGITFHVKKIGEREGARKVLHLPGLPERPDRTTRIRLTLSTPDELTCRVTAEDLGFGELFPASHNRYEMEIDL